MELLNNIRNYKLLMLFNFTIGIFAIMIQSILFAYSFNKLPIIINLFSFAYLLSYIFIGFYSLNKIISLNKKIQELESSNISNSSITLLDDSVRGFKHDFDNIIATIGGYIAINDMNGLKKYFSSLQSDCQNTNNLALLNPNIINNPGIYNLLNSKYHKANDKNIKVTFDFFLDFNELNINMYELSRILGIFLDNAIEAANECEEKIINVKFMNERNRHRHILIIENTYKDKNINTQEIFNKGITGKKSHSGLGLWEVRKYITKNKNLNLITNKNDKYFIQQLEIY